MPVTSADIDDLYQNAPFAYLLMAPDGGIVTANATLAEWTGFSADELAGKRLRDLLTTAARIFYETNVAPVLNLHGAISEAALELRAAGGGTLPVLAVVTSRKTSDGTTGLMRVALFSVAERRKYERQLVVARQASENAGEAAQKLLVSEQENAVLREQFIAVLGHDLRNPLASISGGLRLLQKDQPEERRLLLFDMMRTSVARMSALIDNVLDFARGRLGSGIPVELRGGIWLAPVLEHVVAELHVASPERAIETDIALPEPVKCDPSRLSQLVSNLVGNALAHGSSDQPIRVHADNGGGILTIWVSNGGDPIPDTLKEQLFQPFFRGHAPGNLEGLGLGLHIAAEIAKAHGGTLAVTSTPAETRFTFTMPMGDGGAGRV